MAQLVVGARNAGVSLQVLSQLRHRPDAELVAQHLGRRLHRLAQHRRLLRRALVGPSRRLLRRQSFNAVLAIPLADLVDLAQSTAEFCGVPWIVALRKSFALRVENRNLCEAFHVCSTASSGSW